MNKPRCFSYTVDAAELKTHVEKKNLIDMSLLITLYITLFAICSSLFNPIVFPIFFLLSFHLIETQFHFPTLQTITTSILVRIFHLPPPVALKDPSIILTAQYNLYRDSRVVRVHNDLPSRVV